MNIAIATTAPAHWAPQSECLARAIRELGSAAVVHTPPWPDRAAVCDVLVCLGTGESLRPVLDAAPAAAKILYLIESLPTPAEADPFTRAKLAVHAPYLRDFDAAFVHTPRSVPALRGLGVPRVEPLVWPHFPTLFRPRPGVPKDLDVLFIGEPSPHRRAVIDAVARRHRVTVVRDAFHGAAADLYARARVALNVHFTPLRNFECRVVEALGCGAFLLTEPLDPDDVFEDGRHLAVWTPDTLAAQLDRYLGDDDARGRIARAGHEAVRTFDVGVQARRLVEVAAEVLAGRGGGAPAGRTTVTVAGRACDVRHPPTPAFRYMLAEVFERNSYPPLPFLRDARVVVDVGANVGLTAVWFRAHYPAAAIYALEPGREAFGYLRTNAAGLGDVRVFDHGLLGADGTARLHHGRDTCATASLGPGPHTAASSEEVRVRRAAAFLDEQGFPRVDLLKIDTEGAEVPILRDLAGWLGRVSAVQLEYHSEADRREVDALLAGRFALHHARADQVHRGTLTYVARDVLTRAGLDAWAIPPVAAGA